MILLLLIRITLNLLIAGSLGLGLSHVESTQQAIALVGAVITFLLLELGDKS